jgi:hypothetical protein
VFASSNFSLSSLNKIFLLKILISYRYLTVQDPVPVLINKELSSTGTFETKRKTMCTSYNFRNHCCKMWTQRQKITGIIQKFFFKPQDLHKLNAVNFGRFIKFIKKTSESNFLTFPTLLFNVRSEIQNESRWNLE